MCERSQQPRITSRQLVTIYDILHLFHMRGPKVELHAFLAYFARASPWQKVPTVPTVMRAFERLKVKLSSLLIPFHYEEESAHKNESFRIWLVIPDAGVHLKRVGRMLDERSKLKLDDTS